MTPILCCLLFAAISPLLIYWFIELPDLIFEHRAYVSLIGAAGLLSFLPWWALAPAVIYFAVRTIQRQHAWTTPIRLWEQAYRDGARKVRVLVNLNHCYHAVGQYDKAEIWAKKTLEVAPDMLPVKMNLAVAWANQGRSGDGINLLREACARTPEIGPGWRLLGGFYQSMKDLPSAAQCYVKAAQLSTEDADLHNQLGSIMFQLNRDLDAQRAFERAFELDPRNGI